MFWNKLNKVVFKKMSPMFMTNKLEIATIVLFFFINFELKNHTTKCLSHIKTGKSFFPRKLAKITLPLYDIKT